MSTSLAHVQMGVLPCICIGLAVMHPRQRRCTSVAIREKAKNCLYILADRDLDLLGDFLCLEETIALIPL